jgi:hypothetical protein
VIAASSAFSSRAMSLSGNGGRKLLSCSSSALRARPYIAARVAGVPAFGKLATARMSSE